MTLWKKQQALELQVTNALRREFFAALDDGAGQTALAAKMGQGRSTMMRIAKGCGYHVQPLPKTAPKSPQKPRVERPKKRLGQKPVKPETMIQRICDAMTPMQRHAYERAVRAGTRPIYAVQEAMRVAG